MGLEGGPGEIIYLMAFWLFGFLAFCGLDCGSECVGRAIRLTKCVHEVGAAARAGYVYRCLSPSVSHPFHLSSYPYFLPVRTQNF